MIKQSSIPGTGSPPSFELDALALHGAMWSGCGLWAIVIRAIVIRVLAARDRFAKAFCSSRVSGSLRGRRRGCAGEIEAGADDSKRHKDEHDQKEDRAADADEGGDAAKRGGSFGLSALLSPAAIKLALVGVAKRFRGIRRAMRSCVTALRARGASRSAPGGILACARAGFYFRRTSDIRRVLLLRIKLLAARAAPAVELCPARLTKAVVRPLRAAPPSIHRSGGYHIGWGGGGRFTRRLSTREPIEQRGVCG